MPSIQANGDFVRDLWQIPLNLGVCLSYAKIAPDVERLVALPSADIRVVLCTLLRVYEGHAKKWQLQKSTRVLLQSKHGAAMKFTMACSLNPGGNIASQQRFVYVQLLACSEHL